MNIDNIIQIITAVISIGALIVSIITIILSKKNDKFMKELNKFANKLSSGNIELQIRQLISEAKRHYDEIILAVRKDTDEEKKISLHIRQSAFEDVCNAYEEACAKYLDGKVDKERFKRLYVTEIRNVVEQFGDKYKMPQTKFWATVKVYNEWNNLEQ